MGNSAFTQNNATKLFSGRVGLAWDPFGDGKTAVRAGFGTYYSLIDDLSFLLNSLPPYNGSITASGSLFSITPVIPGAAVPPSWRSGSSGSLHDVCSPGCAGQCKDSYRAGVEPFGGAAADFDYLAARVLRGVGRIPRPLERRPERYSGTDLLFVGGMPGGAARPPKRSSQAAASQSHVAQGAEYIPVGTRPNPYLGAGFFWYTEGNSSYHSLQTELAHRLSRGLEIRANYTWSKNLDMNSGLTGAQSQNQSQMIMDRDNLHRDWGPSALNAASQASISARYELPFGHGKQWLRNASGIESKLVSGWQVNEIATLLTGFPFTPVIGTNRSGDGDTRNPDRPSLNPSFTGPVVTGNPGQWFNPNAFSLPAFGTYGNLGRGVYSGPGLADLDISLFKNTAISERTNLQFRAEFFNVLNHPNLGSPNATVFSGGAINASAGLITTLATTPRQIQFGLKLNF